MSGKGRNVVEVGCVVEIMLVRRIRDGGIGCRSLSTTSFASIRHHQGSETLPK